MKKVGYKRMSDLEALRRLLGGDESEEIDSRGNADNLVILDDHGVRMRVEDHRELLQRSIGSDLDKKSEGL